MKFWCATFLRINIYFLIFYFYIVNCCSESDESDECFDETFEDGLFATYLEKWTLNLDLKGKNHREERVMNLPSTEGGYITSRVDNFTTRVISKPTTLSTSKIVTKPYTNEVNKENQMPEREVTETDLYLLGAMEKLVYKVDFMEKRLKKVEEMLYYVVAGNKIDVDTCPENFTRAGEGCYYFGSKQFDWTIANKFCKSRLKAQLIELQTKKEKMDILNYIQSNTHLRGLDFWTSGLNPGLLWIWGSSGRPVLSNSNENNTELIYGSGRCLGVIYDPSLRRYIYKGQECTTKQHFICEIQDQSSSNEISRVRRELYRKKN